MARGKAAQYFAIAGGNIDGPHSTLQSARNAAENMIEDYSEDEASVCLEIERGTKKTLVWEKVGKDV